MDREELAKIMPILKAFADGKAIEAKENGVWTEIKEPFVLDMLEHPEDYRIKSPDIYVRFSHKVACFQEMQKHEQFGWIKDKMYGNYVSVIGVFDDGISLTTQTKACVYYSFMEAFSFFSFLDGSPFGIKVK